MADEESQASTAPVSNQVEREENTAISQNDGSRSGLPHDNVALQVLSGPSAAIKFTRKESDYTSKAFLGLPVPMPVCDIFLDSPTYMMIMLRVVPRSLVLINVMGRLSIGLVTRNVYFLLAMAVGTLPVMPSTTLLTLFTAPQITWEFIFARLLLRPGKTRSIRWWWFTYFLISSRSDFETNYMRAWFENAPDPQKTTLIFMGDEELSIPRLGDDEPDRIRLERLLLFYHLLMARRGPLELIIPRTVVRLDWVKVENATHILGERIRTMDLGPRTGNLAVRFHKPSLVEAGSRKLAEVEGILEQSLKNDHEDDAVSLGIEFVRQYNRHGIIGIVSIPPISSLVFAIIWISCFLPRGDSDPQAVVQTALTGASYLVTAGALAIALVAYLDTAVDDDSSKIRDVVEAVNAMQQRQRGPAQSVLSAEDTT